MMEKIEPTGLTIGIFAECTNHQYRGQTGPQDAHVELQFAPEGDEDIRIIVTYNPEIGNAIPMHVYHGRSRRYDVSQYLTDDEALALARTLVPLSAELWNEIEIVWDGSNHVGSMSERGGEIDEEIEHVCFDAEGTYEADDEEE